MDSVIYFALLIVSEDVQGPITSYGLGSVRLFLGLRLKLQRDSSSGLVNHHHEKAMLQRAFDDGPGKRLEVLQKGMVASMGYSDIWPVATKAALRPDLLNMTCFECLLRPSPDITLGSLTVNLEDKNGAKNHKQSKRQGIRRLRKAWWPKYVSDEALHALSST
ncbi:hypothetical protein FocTR4_00002705 [Fusarium oxysporum f. sp. cubense]|uniref:Uncharacterized protein n=1 Tax=Fusarium oxysporum f. sp. cubense TaxID=61366 RepID=A0A5C6TBV2_FUSOC|nr:hypothetical protein FocTR4_00002705 [Fusarium oxysporum f. sp. cubense]